MKYEHPALICDFARQAVAQTHDTFTVPDYRHDERVLLNIPHLVATMVLISSHTDPRGVSFAF